MRPQLLQQALVHHGDLMKPAFRKQALDAVRAYYGEHGRLPRWHEWGAGVVVAALLEDHRAPLGVARAAR